MVTGHTVVEVAMVCVTIWMWQLLPVEPGLQEVMVSVTQSYTVEVVHSVVTLGSGVTELGGAEMEIEEAGTEETGTEPETEETGAAELAEGLTELGGAEMEAEEAGAEKTGAEPEMEEIGAAELAELAGGAELGVELGATDTETGMEELGSGSSLQYSGSL